MRIFVDKKSFHEVFVVLLILAIFLGNLWEIKSLAIAFKYIPVLRGPIYYYIREYTSVSLAAAFHTGLADFATNLIKKTEVCRHRNIFKAVDVALKKHLDTFYVISDYKHLRTYVNGSIIDVSSRSYKMDPAIIEKCTIKWDGGDYSVICIPVYVKLDLIGLGGDFVIYDENEIQTIQDILKKSK